jgi:hypothetical protein
MKTVDIKGLAEISYSIENIPEILHWISESSDSGFLRTMALLGDNKDRFTELWGEHQATFRGSEYKYYIWLKEFSGHTFALYTGKRGTSYEIKYGGSFEKFRKDKKVTKVIKEFLLNLVDEIGITEKMQNFINERSKA